MTTPLPPGAIEAEEWYPGTRRLTGNQHGPFLVAFQDASATVPIKWEAILPSRGEDEAFDAALPRQLAADALAAADEIEALT